MRNETSSPTTSDVENPYADDIDNPYADDAELTAAHWAAHLAFLQEEEARGALAFAPDTMPCYECGGFDGVTAPDRAVVKLGPIVEARRDPTGTYILDCGHTTIAC